MGDIANGDNFDKFKAEFEADILARCSSKLLSRLGPRFDVQYELTVDDVSWEVFVGVTIVDRQAPNIDSDEEYLRLAEPTFCCGELAAEGWIDTVASILDLRPSEAWERLVKAGILDEDDEPDEDEDEDDTGGGA